MSRFHSLVAYLATLCAIVALVLAGVFASIDGRTAEALGIGAAVTGLIGVLGTFRPRPHQDDSGGQA